MVPHTACAGDLELTQTEHEILVTLRGKPVMNYIKSEKPVPKGLDSKFRRSGYIHPVYSPTGQEITGDFPADHPHQHALFLAWTKASYDGQKADFWNQAKDLGRVEFREVVDLKQGDEQASFTVRHAFTLPKGKNSIDVLHESWTVTVHHTPEDYFLFDVESTQECATEKSLILPKYHYGGMAFRGNAQWLKEKDDHSIDPGDIQYLTSQDKDRWEGNHTRADWVSFTGKIDEQDVSAAVFCSPKNFRAPQHVRIHPDKPYFCFAPMVEGPFEIEPGKKYVSRYRYLVTSAPADPKMIRRIWKEYVDSEK